jgi:ankyrin repeat protein
MINGDLKAIFQKVGETADFADIEIKDVTTRGLFGDTPLHVAAIWGDVSAGQLLLAAGADRNASGEDGNTPLHEAVAQGNRAFVQLLLESGVSLKELNNEGQTALDLAELLNEFEIKQLLLERGQT